jgi:hypothetical protein
MSRHAQCSLCKEKNVRSLSPNAGKEAEAIADRVVLKVASHPVPGARARQFTNGYRGITEYYGDIIMAAQQVALASVCFILVWQVPHPYTLRFTRSCCVLYFKYCRLRNGFLRNL